MRSKLQEERRRRRTLSLLEPDVSCDVACLSGGVGWPRRSTKNRRGIENLRGPPGARPARRGGIARVERVDSPSFFATEVWRPSPGPIFRPGVFFDGPRARRGPLGAENVEKPSGAIRRRDCFNTRSQKVPTLSPGRVFSSRVVFRRSCGMLRVPGGRKLRKFHVVILSRVGEPQRAPGAFKKVWGEKPIPGKSW